MQMKIRTKIIGGFLCVFLLAVVLGVFGFVTISQIDNMQQDVLLLTELNDTAISLVTAHHVWVYRLAYAFLYGTEFPGGLNPHTCIYGNWLAGDMPHMIDDAILMQLIDDVFQPHYDLHIQGAEALRLREEGNMEEALALLSDVVFPAGVESTARITALSTRYEELRDIQLENLSTFVGASVWVIIIIFAVALVVFVLLSLIITGNILKPLRTFSSWLNHAGSTGDITMSAEYRRNMEEMGSVNDEFGQTFKYTGKLMDHITRMTDELKLLAKGDLSRDIEILSENDTMGIALTRMTDSMNEMFRDIQKTTSQVAAGSKQIADGAQALAQGSTQQAASVQELSASISDIATKTKDNASTAGRTAQMSTSIRESAEKGSRQMDEMITAVNDINEASKSISNIIKTIDDIAFQTNILALNAAVEAARAGQHGKGFAVVAEEVRNLASKSAEAAKDTGTMIQNSMEKAELGSRIASETAESLSEIVSGISESSKLITEIARASEAQSQGISQVNTGIDQVAQVVQQNSATAEESSASSQEMSGLSDVLQQLISQFKLKNASAFKSLPTPSRASSGDFTETAPQSNHASDDLSFGKY